MNRKLIKKIINRLYEKLKKALASVSDDYDAERLHQFRVSYKKFRAFIRLLVLHSGSDTINIPKKLKELYHIGGYIRDMQLQEERISNITDHPKAYLRLLRKKCKRQKLKFKSLLTKSVIEKSNGRVLKLLPRSLPAAALKLFVAQKWSEVLSIVKENSFDDDHLHSIRKELKDIFYNIEIYKNEKGLKLPRGNFNGKGEKYVKQLLEELGDHQDKHRAIELLTMQDTKKNEPQKEMLEIKVTLAAEKLQLKEMLVMKLKEDFGR